MPIISALGRLRQDFQASLGNIENSRAARLHSKRPSQKIKTKQKPVTIQKASTV
jgi:hypothetical protein